MNVEYQSPSYSDDSYYNQLFSRRRSSAAVTRPLSPTPSTSRAPRQLLLHIAVDNQDLEMVKYLLKKGANVRDREGGRGMNQQHTVNNGSLL